MTAYHAVSAALRRVPEAGPLVIIGIGGVGHLAVQVARATSAATVIAVDAHPGRRARARIGCRRCLSHER